jgi:hypothetical protein
MLVVREMRSQHAFLPQNSGPDFIRLGPFLLVRRIAVRFAFCPKHSACSLRFRFPRIYDVSSSNRRSENAGMSESAEIRNMAARSAPDTSSIRGVDQGSLLATYPRCAFAGGSG